MTQWTQLGPRDREPLAVLRRAERRRETTRHYPEAARDRFVTQIAAELRAVLGDPAVDRIAVRTERGGGADAITRQ